MQFDTLRTQRVGVLMSGGLSCTALGAWLAANGVETVSYVADIGQTSPFAPEELAGLLQAHGMQAKVVDLRSTMADMCTSLVKYQATYEGGYWNTTGASRAVLVGGLAPMLREDSCTVLAHGCVGGGNDQARFARYAATHCPDLAVFTPWTQPWMLVHFPDRQAMAGYLTAQGFPAGFTRYTTYSVDGNLGGYSHESDELESLNTPSQAVQPVMTCLPQKAPDTVETFQVRFSAGLPMEVNGRAVTPLEAVQQANERGGRHGISIRSLVENRVNGTKCRGVYEAPGLEILGQCLAALYQVSMDKPATHLFRTLSEELGRAVYEGRFLGAAARAARVAADVLAADASGIVEVGLYKGNFLINGLIPTDGAASTLRQTRFTHGGHHWQTEPYGHPVPL